MDYAATHKFHLTHACPATIRGKRNCYWRCRAPGSSMCKARRPFSVTTSWPCALRSMQRSVVNAVTNCSGTGICGAPGSPFSTTTFNQYANSPRCITSPTCAYVTLMRERYHVGSRWLAVNCQ
ncbi:Uncharacterised protein [Bordetella pertussis]|nr:Uncharacterised protein [Bordetella pertussis]